MKTFQEWLILENADMNLHTINHIEFKDGKWIYQTSKGEVYLPEEDAGKISVINAGLMKFVNAGNPIVKHFKVNNGRIIYAANLCVDGVPIRDSVYLIERQDGRGWAIPGGFIGEGENPDVAVQRELKEEVLVSPGQYILSPIGKIKGDDPREINVFTYAYAALIKPGVELGFGDDAKSGHWYNKADLDSVKFAFAHHRPIIEMALRHKGKI